MYCNKIVFKAFRFHRFFVCFLIKKYFSVKCLEDLFFSNWDFLGLSHHCIKKSQIFLNSITAKQFWTQLFMKKYFPFKDKNQENTLRTQVLNLNSLLFINLNIMIKMYYHWAISSSISSTPNNPLVSILDEFCFSKLGSWVDDSSSSLAFFMCLDKVLLLWYAWNGSSLWEEWCLLAWRFIIEIFAGTIYPSLQFSLETSGSLKSPMQLCISLTLIAKVFFSFLN